MQNGVTISEVIGFVPIYVSDGVWVRGLKSEVRVGVPYILVQFSSVQFYLHSAESQ